MVKYQRAESELQFIYGSGAKSREYEPSWSLLPYESTFSVPKDIKSG